MIRKQSLDRRLRMMIGVNLIWLGIVFVLAAWWGRLLFTQAAKIAELETALGRAKDLTQSHWHRTQRMLYWESSFFFVLLLVCTVFLFWLYWRDLKRGRGLQAFFASVTHELRTPLTSIRLQAESIADTIAELKLAECTVHGNVQRLFEDTVRLEAQVERTLELARLEGGGPVYLQPIQIKPWLERFLKVWESDYKGRVQFQSNIEDVLVEADSAGIQVIFRNLFENSVRHSKQEQVLISISASIQNNGVSVLVKDNGQGFHGDEKSLGKLFEKGPYSQGTGVGLYLVKVLMGRMGGWAEFMFDSGFEVTLWFPEGDGSVPRRKGQAFSQRSGHQKTGMAHG